LKGISSDKYDSYSHRRKKDETTQIIPSFTLEEDKTEEKERTTDMLHIPRVVSRSREPDQQGMIDNCFSEENQISLVQASQIPVEPITSIQKS